MARATFGTIVTELRGKVGGNVFQRNGYGHTFKVSPNMGKPNSLDQLKQQAFMSALTKQWSTADQAARDLYDTYASTYPQYAKNNPSSQLSGYALALKWNATRSPIIANLYEGITIADVTFASLSFTAVIDGPLCMLNLIPSIQVPTAQVLISVSPPVNPSLTFPSCPFGVFNVMDMVTSDVDIASFMLNKWGVVLTAGDYIYIRAVPHGIESPKMGAIQYFLVEVTSV